MRVSLDLDGLCLDFVGRYTQLYYEWFGIHVDITTWDGIVTDTHFTSSGQAFEWFNKAGGWDDMPFLPGAPGGVAALKAAGLTVMHVTSRPQPAELATIRSVKRLHNDDQFNRLWFRAGDQKGTVPADVYVDDSPEVLRALHKAGKRAIRFAQPWNEKERLSKDIEVVSDWADLVELLTGTSWKKVA